MVFAGDQRNLAVLVGAGVPVLDEIHGHGHDAHCDVIVGGCIARHGGVDDVRAESVDAVGLAVLGGLHSARTCHAVAPYLRRLERGERHAEMEVAQALRPLSAAKRTSHRR